MPKYAVEDVLAAPQNRFYSQYSFKSHLQSSWMPDLVTCRELSQQQSSLPVSLFSLALWRNPIPISLLSLVSIVMSQVCSFDDLSRIISVHKYIILPTGRGHKSHTILIADSVVFSIREFWNPWRQDCVLNLFVLNRNYGHKGISYFQDQELKGRVKTQTLEWIYL